MKTIKFFALLSWAFDVANLLSCATPKAFPVGPTPLDTPGGLDTTLPTIRQSHMRAITGNPGWR